MQIEINETNIDKYDLTKLTGNSREDLLSRAAEARQNDLVLNAKVPDDLIHTNVFEAIESVPAPEEAQHGDSQCTYERRVTHNDSTPVWLCKFHGVESKHDIVAGSHRPCLAVDPY